MARFNFYTVAKGKYPHSPGIYRTWAEADSHVTGVPDALHRGHKTREQAERWLAQNREDRADAATPPPAPETPRRARDMAERSLSDGPSSSSPSPALLPVSTPSSPDGDPFHACCSWYICTTPAVVREYLDADSYERVSITALGSSERSGQYRRASNHIDDEDEFQYYYVPMPFSMSKKFYAVARGYTPGVYTSYHGPQGAFKQVDGYSENVYKKFGSEQEAWDYILEYRRQQHEQRRTARTKKQRVLLGGTSDAWEGIREERLDAAARRLAAQMSPSSSRAPSPVPLDIVVHVAGAYAVDSGRAGIGLFFDFDDWHNSSERCPAGWESQERADIFAVVRALQVAPRSAGRLSIMTASIDSIASLAYCSGRERAYINKQLARRRRREQTVRILPADTPCTPALEMARFGAKLGKPEDIFWAARLSRLATPADDDVADDELDAVLRASFASGGGPGSELGAAPLHDDAENCDARLRAEDRVMAAQSDSADVAMLDGCRLSDVQVSSCDVSPAVPMCARGNATAEGEPAVLMDGPSATSPLLRAAGGQDARLDAQTCARTNEDIPALDPPGHDAPRSVAVSDDEFPDDDSSWMDAAPADWLAECERRPQCSTQSVAVADTLPSLTPVDHTVCPAGQEEYDDWMDALPVGLLWEYAGAVAEPTARAHTNDAPPRPTPHSGFGGAFPDQDDDLDSASAWIDGIPESQLASFDRDSLDDADDSDWIDTLSVEELNLLDGGQL
ncbi:hypothetical protein AURDEDRAFT_164422 [Auricularia subglabra TFB-10046 SS5]|nr:hypothetical protein AURDEDRAFT_164422 [Auricularia subglabra TFB-10046 SS5]